MFKTFDILLHKFNYTLIPRIGDDERTLGASKFEKPLEILERVEAEEQKKKSIIEQELKDDKIHSQMFVEYLNTGKLFDMMYEHDEEGQ